MPLLPFTIYRLPFTIFTSSFSYDFMASPSLHQIRLFVEIVLYLAHLLAEGPEFFTELGILG